MSDNTAVAKDSIAAYNDKDWDKATALMASNVVYDEAGTGRRIEGKGQIIESYQGWATAFPDSTGTITNTIASGNTVVLQLTWKGTHTGPLLTPGGEIPATGKSIEIPACMVVNVEAGKVASSTHYFNLLTMLQQLGVA